MKSLVLSGGAGLRLRPLTYSMPKQLVPVANKPVLRYVIEDIKNAGISDVGIVVGDRIDAVRGEFGDGSALDLRITYIRQDKPRGLAHCVQISRGFLGDEDFVMYLGDNIMVPGISEVVAEFTEHRPAAQVAVAKVSDPSEYGIAVVDADGRVLDLEEKPAKPRGDLALMGVYVFTPAIHRAVREIRPSRRGEWEITDAIQQLINTGQPVRAQVFTGFWKDTGRLADVLDCNQILLELTPPDVAGDVDADSELIGPVTVEPGARIIRSQVHGPAAVGAGAVVTDSIVGPYTSVGRDCVLHNAGIEDSILLAGASIRSLHGVRRSLIGRSSRLDGVARRDTELTLMVGDDSRLEIS
jgi:glucose-1-phosphate thymidylyltransferase